MLLGKPPFASKIVNILRPDLASQNIFTRHDMINKAAKSNIIIFAHGKFDWRNQCWGWHIAKRIFRKACHINHQRNATARPDKGRQAGPENQSAGRASDKIVSWNPPALVPHPGGTDRPAPKGTGRPPSINQSGAYSARSLATSPLLPFSSIRPVRRAQTES